jgi:putative NADH-flavin reductase
MHIFVAGATGRVGRSFVEQALAAGHELTAFVRKRGELRDSVAVIEGDVIDAAAVRAAVVGDAIVSTLGGGSPKAPGTALSAGTGNLVAAAQARGLRRMLAVVGAGVLQADETRLRNELPGYPPFLAAISREHTAAYRDPKSENLNAGRAGVASSRPACRGRAGVSRPAPWEFSAARRAALPAPAFRCRASTRRASR